MKYTHKKIHNLLRSHRSLFSVTGIFLFFTILIFGLFFITKGGNPYVSELAFIEHSTLGKEAGSVIPASCESAYNHYGECYSPPGVYISVSPSVIGAGQSFNLSYSSTGATNCTMYASNGWYTDGGGTAYTWYGWGGPQYSSMNFQVQCANAYYGTWATSPVAYLTVYPVPTVSASISPAYVSYGGSFNSMSYSSTNASYCNYGPTSYTWGVNGPYYSNQTWTFVCYNPAGQSAQQSVTLNVCPASAPVWTGSVCAPPATATLNPFIPSTIITGNSSSFTYTSTGATSCTGFGIINGNLGSTNSTVSTGIMNTPGLYTQSVTCTGVGGSGTSVTRALVVDGPASLTPGGLGSDTGFTGFTLSPRSVDRGGLIKLNWGIHYPNSQCKIIAAVQIPATCDATCQSDRAAASSTINSILTSGTTNTNDPYGASRNMTTALRTKVPSTQYARGEKSITLDYSTTFTLSCGDTFVPAKRIIYVTERNEG